MQSIDILILSMKFLPASGGSATYAYNLALGLHQAGYKVIVYAPYYRRLKQQTDTYPFEVRRMKGTSEFFFLIRHIVAYIHMRSACRREKPAMIWATTYAGCIVLGMGRFEGVRLLGTIHGGSIHRRFPSRNPLTWFGNRLGIRFFRRADAVVTVSHESKQMMIERLEKKIDWPHLHVIYNGIHFDETHFVDKITALRHKPEFGDKKIILTVGRLVKAKGHDIVIHALPELIKKYPELIYILVGEGPEKELLQSLVKKLALEKFVMFTGYVTQEEMEIYFGLCDIFVMAGRVTPHFIEGFGLVYIEAGIRGKPVIGTRVGGIPEAVRDGQTGLLVEPERPDQIAEKIDYLLQHPEIRKEMGLRAQSFIQSNFTTAIMAQQNVKLIQDIFQSNEPK